MTALLLHRIHFGFTVTYHYLFPQLTMGLALLIVVFKTIAIRHKDERYNEAARFCQRLADYAAGNARKLRPVGAKLKFHRNASDHSNQEIDGKKSGP